MNYYSRYTRSIIASGSKSAPRGLSINFKQNQTFATVPGITYRRAGDNPLIGFMEGLQFIAGVGSVEDIARIAPKAKLELFGIQALYGPRANGQTEEVINELNADRDSRRAVIILGRSDEPLKDRPCTTSLQFQIFEGRLTTIATMRSSDAVYGLPYDLIQFSMMAQMIGMCTDSMPASLIVNIGNAHVYEETAHLAVNYTPWTFKLPQISNEYIEWKAWALESIKTLSSQMIKDEFGFGPGKETVLWR
jgi:hypothetical protein